MNRMEEYQNWMAELEATAPELEGTVARAEKRSRRKQLWTRPLAGLAACFAIFVLLVNFSAPVAYACSQIPGLRELAAAVTFSRSLGDAVKNEYVQPMNLSQTKNGITVSVEYLIVDQKQVNIFYRISGKSDTGLGVDPDVRNAEGEYLKCSWYLNSWDETSGVLQSMTVDFADGTVPAAMQLQMGIGGRERFDFLLEFDPEFTAAGKIIPVNQTVILDGQSITVTEVEVYPTHLRVNIAGDPENTAWLKKLDFYIETDWGMRFDIPSSGIIAQGTTDTPTMTSYRADSTWFYEAEHLKIVITGATWLRKDMEKIYVNLETGETGPLPDGVEFHSAVREDNGWQVEFTAPLRDGKSTYQIFSGVYYDPQGNWDVFSIQYQGLYEPGDKTFFKRVILDDYPHNEVWLSLVFSNVWEAENVIMIMVQ